MNNTYRYLILYTLFLVGFISIIMSVDAIRDTNLEFQKKSLLKQAQTHFNDQVNTREWNARHGSVYVIPKDAEEPNLYLKDNILRVDDNLTLIKINPAWMTRQLSELARIDGFSFRITSLIPINPNNVPNEFEKRALEYLDKNKGEEYYELTDKFSYMGALKTTQSCLPCHKHQGYKLGDIRGGISIYLNADEYNKAVSNEYNRSFIIKILLILLALTITVLLHKQFKSNERLTLEVLKRTKEMHSTKKLLQNILDADLSFLIVAECDNIIFTNKTMLDFFGFNTLSEFQEKYTHLSDTFEEVDDKDFIQHFMDDEHWIKYLQKEQENRYLKILIKKDGKNRYFKPHVQEIDIDNKKVHLIIFDEITKELHKMQKLEKSATVDSLTKLFNRAKFDDVLSKEILLTQTTNISLSIIFLDIDHFKDVNDTYGHDVGDIVLIELSKLLKSTVRKGDFVARWGGEEFMITLKSADVSEATELAEKIRQKVQDHKFEMIDKLTISLGVTQYIANESEDSFTKRVDKALYEAKNSGRNRVVSK